jgi:hypothetical protein
LEKRKQRVHGVVERAVTDNSLGLAITSCVISPGLSPLIYRIKLLELHQWFPTYETSKKKSQGWWNGSRG